MIFRSMKRALLQSLLLFIFAITMSYAEIVKEVLNMLIKIAVWAVGFFCLKTRLNLK